MEKSCDTPSFFFGIIQRCFEILYSGIDIKLRSSVEDERQIISMRSGLSLNSEVEFNSFYSLPPGWVPTT